MFAFPVGIPIESTLAQLHLLNRDVQDAVDEIDHLWWSLPDGDELNAMLVHSAALIRIGKRQYDQEAKLLAVCCD